MSRMLRCLTAAAVVLGQSACATVPRAPPARPPSFERVVTIGDLIGKTPAEVRQRLWAREADHDYVQEARLGPDGEIVVRASLDILRAGGACSPGAGLRFRLQGDPRINSYPRFVFLKDRLQEVLPLTGDAPFAADQQITVTCNEEYRVDPVDSALSLVFFGPWAAMVAAGRLPETVARASVRGELEKLRLGEPPPGGLETYAKKPPADIEVVTKEHGAALVTVNLGTGPTTRRPAPVRVEIAQGRVVAIVKDRDNFVPCWIESDRAFHCGATAAPL